VDAEPDPGAICAAVAAGRVQVVARPLSWLAAAGIMADVLSEVRGPRRLAAEEATTSTAIGNASL
jgi:hypothetical protein